MIHGANIFKSNISSYKLISFMHITRRHICMNLSNHVFIFIYAVFGTEDVPNILLTFVSYKILQVDV